MKTGLCISYRYVGEEGLSVSLYKLSDWESLSFLSSDGQWLFYIDLDIAQMPQMSIEDFTLAVSIEDV